MSKKAVKRKPATQTTTNIRDQLKAEIEEAELTVYAIAKAADIAPGLISRFMSGERDMRLESAAKVAEVLGLELRSTKRRK